MFDMQGIIGLSGGRRILGCETAWRSLCLPLTWSLEQFISEPSEDRVLT